MDSNDSEDVEVEEILQSIRDKHASHRAHLNLLNLQRRELLNAYLDLKGDIRVFCRIRPSLPHEKSQRQSTVVLVDNNVLLKVDNKGKRYNFDKVFHPHSTQEEVFSEVEPVIKSALDGYNVCIFAYGQTGTGKTFTMEGRSDCPGVVPRAMGTLFDQAKTVNCKLTLGFSMLEIYMGRLKDLLVVRKEKSLAQTTPCLSIKMDHSGSIQIENLIEIKVSDFEQVKRLYRLGSRLRSTASTMSNATSSRSHCLIRISITSAAPERRRTANKIWMVDLGGSERLLKTQARGRRLEEGKAINLSLSALGDVISSLHNKKSHVPYRNSKLTQVLRDSLGEDSKTLMLVHVSPEGEDTCETICSLGFATRVRSIHLGQDEPPDVRACKESMLAELSQKLNHLESESQHVMKDIKELNEDIGKLNETFKQSGEKGTLNSEHLEALHLNVEDEKFSMRTSHHTRDVKGISTNQPRFMRPTVCSHRKARMNQFSENTTKKRRVASKEAFSVCAETVEYHMEGILRHDLGSESSISGFGHINWKYDLEIEPEGSQNLSECEIKTVIFTEQQKAPSSSEMSENCQSDKVHQKKHLHIDEWLLFQPEDLLNTRTQWSKRVFALPEPEQNGRFSEGMFKVMDEEIDTSKYSSVEHAGISREENDYNHKNTDFFIDTEVQKVSEDTLKEESSTNIVSSTDILSTSLLSERDAACCQNIESAYMHQNLKLVSESESCLKLTAQKSEIGSEDSVIFAQAEEIEVLVSAKGNVSELNRKIEDLLEPELGEEHRGSSIWLGRTQRSLFMHKHAQTVEHNNLAAEEVLAMPTTEFEEPNRGMFLIFVQIVQILYAIALLGLGSESMPWSDDFFHWLML